MNQIRMTYRVIFWVVMLHKVHLLFYSCPFSSDDPFTAQLCSWELGLSTDFWFYLFPSQF